MLRQSGIQFQSQLVVFHVYTVFVIFCVFLFAILLDVFRASNLYILFLIEWCESLFVEKPRKPL